MSIIYHGVILLRCVGKYAVAHTEVNYKMADSKQNNTSVSTFVAFLLVVYFMFSAQVDADLLVNPTLIKQELQSIATDALGVDKMQVSRMLQHNRFVLVGWRLSSHKLRIQICVGGSGDGSEESN